jgi:hypothetical protein
LWIFELFLKHDYYSYMWIYELFLYQNWRSCSLIEGDVPVAGRAVPVVGEAIPVAGGTVPVFEQVALPVGSAVHELKELYVEELRLWLE